ncbi:hypothetical protein EXIGLDRAFT_696706 [Exidia glandulosa HHB12029]|uniref:Uncharacterized protein n=1 Tax=Exidia glandulosa HHB12029 TaxID=1314781 RepID=A0A165N1X5_EXIGL|nr:hypothetical protein EXIGLDRAFT_696706 [Exidia glandulosa HHB12029]
MSSASVAYSARLVIVRDILPEFEKETGGDLGDDRMATQRTRESQNRNVETSPATDSSRIHVQPASCAQFESLLALTAGQLLTRSARPPLPEVLLPRTNRQQLAQGTIRDVCKAQTLRLAIYDNARVTDWASDGISGRASSILHGEVFAQIAAFTVADRDRESRLYSDHLLKTTLLERHTSRLDFERRIRRMNARSYYRWLFALAEQHRGLGLHPRYTPGHSAAVDLPAALNAFADHYATKAQSHRDDLSAALTPSFAMDNYTFWTAPDGWICPSLAAAAAAWQSHSTQVHGRVSIHTRTRASYSAAVQLYARSGQLPTARTLADRNRSIVCMSFVCRHGCIAVEDDYYVFVNCARLVTALSDEQSAGIIAASETFYSDSDLWPTTHAMYFLGLTPKLAGLIPRAAFSSNTSYCMPLSAWQGAFGATSSPKRNSEL